MESEEEMGKNLSFFSQNSKIGGTIPNGKLKFE